jgi:hypothetical protein
VSASGESTFLDELLSSLRRRRKAIRHRTRTLRFERVSDSIDGSESAKVEIECVLLAPRTVLRLSAWEDRWVWVDARRSGKIGWVWQFTAEGRLLGNRLARELVSAFEASIGDQGSEAALRAIWAPILAQGPRRVG